jgi:hypothetical protein
MKPKQHAIKKKAAKKRAYNRKPKTDIIENVRFPIVVQKKDTEIEELAALCSIMDNFTTEQKQRVLKFLCGRYYDFL